MRSTVSGARFAHRGASPQRSFGKCEPPEASVPSPESKQWRHWARNFVIAADDEQEVPVGKGGSAGTDVCTMCGHW